MNLNTQTARLLPGTLPAQRMGSPSFWLLLVAYPFLSPLGTLPVIISGTSYSVEYFFAVFCVLVVTLELAASRLRLAWCNGLFVLGSAMWLAANVVSLAIHFDVDASGTIVSMLLKAFFGYLVFVVLMGNGRWSMVLKSYVAGCAVAGIFTVAFVVESGSLEVLRQTSFAGEDMGVMRISLFDGIARQGAGNLLPLWVCVVLYVRARRKSERVAILALMPYFAVLALLALRREVLLEGTVGFVVLLFALRGWHRLLAGVAGVIIGTSIVVVVAQSERWQERLLTETKTQFEAGTDTRLILLKNTPAELMKAPILGHGPGSYSERMIEYLPPDPNRLLYGIGAHNSFSRAAVESGFIGLLGFTLMIAALTWNAWLRRRKGVLPGSALRIAAVMIFLHVADWLFFGDGIVSNTTWYFIGVLLYLDRVSPVSAEPSI